MIALVFSLLLGLGNLGQAEHAYRAGRYEAALTLFQDALSEPGVPQGPVLYNLGNCAYRLGRHAEAVLYYRRALLRLPRDRSVQFNLSLAKHQLGIDAPSGGSFGAAVVALVDAFTPGELLVLVGVLQGVGLVGFTLLGRRRWARNGMALLVLLALAGAARLVHTQWFFGPPAGVVLSPTIALRLEPHTDLAVVLELKAGETVRVEERSDRWVRVVHAKGGGWTGREGVGLVE